MKKLFLSIPFILAMAIPAMAQSEVCASSLTVITVSVSSFSATQIDSTTRRMPDRKWVEIQNISTDVVHCMQSSFVTTSTGRLLTASGGSWSLNIKDGFYTVTTSTFSPHISARTLVPLSLYCIGSGSLIPSSVALSQCK